MKKLMKFVVLSLTLTFLITSCEQEAVIEKDSCGAITIIELPPICNLNPLRIGISLDDYGSESSWELYDNADTSAPIAMSTPYTDGTSNIVRDQVPVDICLPDGSYTFLMYDEYGDGMEGVGGNGFYKLSKMNSTWTTETELIKQNGVFGADDAVEFMLP